MVHLRLAKLLKLRGISKRKLALALSVQPRNASRWFYEDYDPKLSVLAGWAKVIGCKISDLYIDPNYPAKPLSKPTKSKRKR